MYDNIKYNGIYILNRCVFIVFCSVCFLLYKCFTLSSNIKGKRFELAGRPSEAGQLVACVSFPYSQTMPVLSEGAIPIVCCYFFLLSIHNIFTIFHFRVYILRNNFTNGNHAY